MPLNADGQKSRHISSVPAASGGGRNRKERHLACWNRLPTANMTRFPGLPPSGGTMSGSGTAQCRSTPTYPLT